MLDQEKTGKYIAEKRKQLGMTQRQLKGFSFGKGQTDGRSGSLSEPSKQRLFQIFWREYLFFWDR